MDPTTAAMALGSIGKLLGSFGIGNNPEEWKQDALVALYNRAQQGDEMARQMFAMFADPARQSAIDVSGALTRPTVDLAPYLMQWGQDALSGVRPTIDSERAGALSPEMMRALQALQGLNDKAGAIGDTAAAGFQGGGWTPQGAGLMEALSGLLSGTANNAQLSLGDVGPNLISQRGQTDFTRNTQDRAIDAANSGGMNPYLDSAMASALRALANEGETGTSGALSGKGLEFLERGGEKALGDNLLSPELASNWAREDFLNQAAAQREALARHAQSRGTLPGSGVVGSLENQLKAEFADQTARGAADAARKMYLAQEEKMLQDKGLAAQVASAGASAAGTGGSLANSRYSTALGAVPGTQNAATGFLNTLLDAGSSAGGLETARMNSGTNMLQTLLGSQGQAGGALSSALANQNQYALGLGALGNNAGGAQSANLGTMLQSILGAEGQANQRASTAIGGANNAVGNLGNLWQGIAGANQAAINPLTQLAGQALNYGGNYVGLMGAPFGRLNWQGNTTPWGEIGGFLGGLIPKK